MIRRDELKDCWRADLTVGHKRNEAGNIVPVRKVFYGKTKKEVQKKIDEYKEKERQGIEHRTQAFGILADDWIEHFFLKDGDLADSTKIMYHDAWRVWMRQQPIYCKPLNEVTTMVLQRTYNDLYANGCTTASLKKINKLLRKFYSYIEAEGLGRDYSRSLKIPKNAKKEESDISVWTEDEKTKIFSGFDSADSRFRLRFFIVLLRYTGCRYSELMGLKYEDITEKGIRINKQLGNKIAEIDKDGRAKRSLEVTDTKTGSSVRTMPVTPSMMEEFERHKKWHMREMQKRNKWTLKQQAEKKYLQEFVFTAADGSYYDHTNVTRALDRYYKRVGVEPKTIHTWRHTFATDLARKGVPIQTVAQLLGDTVATTSKYYVYVSDDEKLDAVKKLESVINA